MTLASRRDEIEDNLSTTAKVVKLSTSDWSRLAGIIFTALAFMSIVSWKLAAYVVSDRLADYEAVKADVSHHGRDIPVLQSGQEALSVKIDTVSKERGSQIDTVNMRVDDLKSRSDTYSRDMSLVLQSLAAIRSDVNNMNQRFDETNRRLSEIREDARRAAAK